MRDIEPIGWKPNYSREFVFLQFSEGITSAEGGGFHLDTNSDQDPDADVLVDSKDDAKHRVEDHLRRHVQRWAEQLGGTITWSTKRALPTLTR